MPISQRDYSLDILRALGLFLIILAHCNPPDWLFQLRNFDVPLMVIVSAATYSFLYQDKHIDLRDFYKKRLRKLVFPAWIFLSLFFSVTGLVCIGLHTDFPFSTQDILSSYLFYSGIGYVWILRIFILIALFTPPLLSFKKTCTRTSFYFALVLSVYVAYEIAVILTHTFLPSGSVLEFLDTMIFPIIPYAVLYAYGIKMSELGQKSFLAITAICCVIFTGMALYSATHLHTGFVQTQTAKYPPTLYYLSYAIFCTNAVYLLSQTKYAKFLPEKCLTWVSVHSLWIYLWHIGLLYLWKYSVSLGGSQLFLSLAKFLCISTAAMLITYIQTYTLETLSRKLSRLKT